MIVNGSFILLIVGAWAAYKLGCWVHDRTTNHEVGSHNVPR